MDSDEKLLQLLKLNWDHGRHLENQRMKMAAMYTGGMLMLLLALFKLENIYASLLAELIGIVLTIVCFATTYKWNIEFQNQIKSADKCAKMIQISVPHWPKVNAHWLLGFPIRSKHLAWLNVRLTYSILYWSFLGVWVSAFVITTHQAWDKYHYLIKIFSRVVL